MLNTITIPAGIDVPIKRLQQRIHSSLLTKWAIDTSLYQCYGRCYRNKKDDGYIAEVFQGGSTTGGTDYKEVYWDDTLAAISFFGLSGEQEYQTGGISAGVHLVFFVNIATLKPSITHRADEEVRRDVIDAIGRAAFGLQLEGVELWLENVLREYPGSRRDDRLARVDMHPVHCFRLNLTLKTGTNCLS